jgi:hypothetical protein
MKFKQFLIVLAVCVVIILLLYLFSLEKPLSAEQVSRAVADYKEMEKVLHAETIDYEKVDALYKNGVAPILYEVDEAEEQKFHFNVEDTIERAKKGKIPKIAAHVVEKPIQHAFYRYMIIELGRLGQGKEENQALLEKARLCFSVLEPTIAEAGKFIRDDGALALRARSLFESAAKSTDVQKDVAELETLYKGVSVLMVLSAMEDIEKWQHRDKLTALTHMADAKMHYTILYEDHGQKDRAEAVLILNEFSKLPKEVDTRMMRANLKKAFTGLIPELTDERFDKKEEPPEAEEEP